MDLDRASVPRSVQCFFQPLQSVYSSRDCKVDFKLRGGGVGWPPRPPPGYGLECTHAWWLVHAMLTMSFVIPASVTATVFSWARSGGAVGPGLSEMSIINIGYIHAIASRHVFYMLILSHYPNIIQTFTLRFHSWPVTINSTSPLSIAYYLIAAVPAWVDCSGTDSCSRSREV